jgi:hypothetical protein
MIFSEQRLSKMWRSGPAVAGFATLAIVLSGPFAPAQQAAVGQPNAMSPHLSENVRKQILEKLVQGTHDPDEDVANHSLAGLAPTADAAMATQALVAILDRQAVTKEAMLQKLHFAGCLLAHGIAREQVVASVLEAAKTSEHPAVRFRAINVLLFAAAGDTSADVVRMLIATAENPESPPHATTSNHRRGGSSKASQWAVDRPVVKSLVARAVGNKVDSEADRAERVISAFLIATQSADEARAEAELVDLVTRYNGLIKQDRWSEAKFVARRAQELAPDNPVTLIMYNKAVIGRQVARNADFAQHGDADTATENDALLAPAPLDSEQLAPATLSAIAHIVPQTDEVAVALMEALQHKDLRVRRSASRALANAVHGSTDDSSSEK